MKLTHYSKIFLAILSFSILFTACKGKTEDKNSETTNTEESKTDAPGTKVNATVIHLNKAEFLAKVVNYEADSQNWKYLGDKPAIIDFYATWCGPCKTLAPVLDQLAAEYAEQIYIYKIDTDKEPELAQKFGIQSLPTLLFIPMNEKPQVTVGGLPKNEIKIIIENFLLKK